MSDTKKPRLCTGCVHYISMWPHDGMGLCSYGSRKSVVDGSLTGEGLARYARQETGHCGPDAKHFSPSYAKWIGLAVAFLALMLLWSQFE